MSESGHNQINYGNWKGKKKRFRDREFVRDQEYNRDQPFTTSRYDGNRSAAMKDGTEEQDKSQASLSQPNTKPPVILAKPGKPQGISPTVSESGGASSWHEVAIASSPTAAIAPKLSMTISRSPQSSGGDKKNPLSRPTSDAKFRNSASPNLVKQSLAQAGASANATQQNTAHGTSGKLKDNFGSKSCVKMLDSSLYWQEGGIELLQDQSDFLVVGVIGMQGVGKSTVMSIIAGNRLEDPAKSYLFRQQTHEVKERASHMTAGIDMAITNERLILLDTQPILSSSLLEQSIHYDRKSSSDYNGSSSIEIQSLQIAAFLMTVCHVVIVVQDWFTDSNIYKFLLTAEMLKPVTTPPTHDNNSTSIRDPSNLQPVLVFVHNKMDSDMFNIRTITTMNEVMDNAMRFSNLHCKGYFSLIETNLYPGLSTICQIANEVNSFLLPNIRDSTNEEEKCDVTKVTYDPADQQFLALPQYVGRPSTALLESTFRKTLLSIPRNQLTHLPLTEKNWFHYSARTWETIRKSQLISEYNRLLSG